MLPWEQTQHKVRTTSPTFSAMRFGLGNSFLRAIGIEIFWNGDWWVWVVNLEMNLPEVGRRETIPRPETNRSVLSVLSEGKDFCWMCWHGTDWVLPVVFGEEGGNGKVKPCLLSQRLKSQSGLSSTHGIDCTHAAQMRDTLREKEPTIFPQSITF